MRSRKNSGAEDCVAELALEARLKTETIDVTLPARPESLGTVHPVTQSGRR